MPWQAAHADSRNSAYTLPAAWGEDAWACGTAGTWPTPCPGSTQPHLPGLAPTLPGFPCHGAHRAGAEAIQGVPSGDVLGTTLLWSHPSAFPPWGMEEPRCPRQTALRPRESRKAAPSPPRAVLSGAQESCSPAPCSNLQPRGHWRAVLGPSVSAGLSPVCVWRGLRCFWCTHGRYMA